MLKEDGGTKWEIGIKSIPFTTITGVKTLRRSFSLRIPSLFVSCISKMRLSRSLSQASFNLKEECYFGISDLDQPAQVKTCQNILQILKKKMILSDNLQVLYKNNSREKFAIFASTTTATICICCKKLSQTKKCKKVAQNNNLQVLGKK